MKYLITLALILLAGCVTRPLKPGVGVISLPNATSIIQQSENPKTESSQHYEKITENGKTVEKIDTKVGAAQPDTAREIAAKLSSLKGVVWVGILLFVGGVASAVWPPLKAIVGSVTTSAVTALAGLALIVLPSVVVGHEVLILILGVSIAALYAFAHRHGALRGRINERDGI